MTIDFSSLSRSQKDAKVRTLPPFATVVEVKAGKGVKIRLDGKPEPRDIYYNSLVPVVQGDRVHIKEIADSILIIGKLQY